MLNDTVANSIEAAPIDSNAEDIRAEAVRIIEKVWQEAEAAARRQKLVAQPNWGDRPLTEQERRGVDAYLNLRGEETGVSAYKIEKAMLNAFGAETLGDIKAWNFNEVIRYLVYFDGSENDAGTHGTASSR